MYFDELGPPWPKHRCTIQEKQGSSFAGARSHGPAVRPHDERKALVHAAECVGMLKGHSFGNDSRAWELFVVTKVSTKSSIVVHGESLSGPFGKKTSFEFKFSESVILIGDLFSKKRKIISFVRRDIFEPVEIKNGDNLPSLAKLAIEAKKVTEAAAKREREIKKAAEKKRREQVARENERNRIAALRTDPSNLMKIEALQMDARRKVQERVKIIVVKKKIKKFSSFAQTTYPIAKVSGSKKAEELTIISPTLEIPEFEIKKFQSTKRSVADLCRQLEPIVKGYARVGIRKPREVADKLNSDGHRTADAQPWTTHLAFILLRQIFSGPPREGYEEKQPSPNSTSKSDNPRRVSTKDEKITQDDLEKRLSALGRVTKRQN